MAYKAILFDLDGTLVHTMPEYRYKVVGKTLEDLGTKSTNNYIDRFWFEARRNDVIKEHFNVEPKIFWNAYNENDTTELRKGFTELYDDVGFVDEVNQKGYKTGIVTGAPLNIASLEIDMIGQEKFGAIVVANSFNGFKPKPHPHGLEECLDILEVKPNEAMYIGNADEDVIAAKNANIYDVFINRGEHEFPHIKPSLTINSLYELRKLIN